MSTKKTIVITGVTRGIGKGLIENLSNNDSCQTVIGICRDSAQFNELKKKFAGNDKVKLFSADVANFDSLNSVIQSIHRENIHPDMVIANAGIITPTKPCWEVTQQEMDESYEVNVRGVFNTMKAFLPHMKDRPNAAFVNLSSHWGQCGCTGRLAFCMSKFAVEGMTQAAALDVAKLPCTIVSVDPGMVYSDMLVETFGESEAKKIGVPCEKFVPHFVEKMWGIQKSSNGQHLNFALEGYGAGPRATGK